MNVQPPAILSTSPQPAYQKAAAGKDKSQNPQTNNKKIIQYGSQGSSPFKIIPEQTQLGSSHDVATINSHTDSKGTLNKHRDSAKSITALPVRDPNSENQPATTAADLLN